MTYKCVQGYEGAVCVECVHHMRDTSYDIETVFAQCAELAMLSMRCACLLIAPDCCMS